jgi:hypothetical protein
MYNAWVQGVAAAAPALSFIFPLIHSGPIQPHCFKPK